MIPKKIHYCWFGRGQKPTIVQKCIESWKKYLPEFEIIEWNEDNFDINQFSYTKDAYNAKKYAFVSDVARVKALNEQGGIYFDTDVEVLQTIDEEILNHPCVLGFERGNYIATSYMACEKGFSLMKDFYNLYESLSFYDQQGNIIPGTNVTKLTNLLSEYGLNRNNQKQTLSNGIEIYPSEYFSPFDYGIGVYEITEKSFCVHHFYVSWMPWYVRLRKKMKKILVKIIGKERMKKILK